jgi:hypothetical protein
MFSSKNIRRKILSIFYNKSHNLITKIVSLSIFYNKSHNLITKIVSLIYFDKLIINKLIFA